MSRQRVTLEAPGAKINESCYALRRGELSDDFVNNSSLRPAARPGPPPPSSASDPETGQTLQPTVGKEIRSY